MTWLLNGILSVIKYCTIYDLGLVHRNNHYWVATFSCIFLALVPTKNVEEVEASTGTGIWLWIASFNLFLCDFDFRHTMCVILGFRYFRDALFIFRNTTHQRALPACYWCSMLLIPNYGVILNDGSIRRDLTMSPLMCNHVRQVFGHSFVGLAQSDHNRRNLDMQLVLPLILLFGFFLSWSYLREIQKLYFSDLH